MNFLHSIRWRLQVWHGLLLVLVLSGFGYTAWRLEQATLLLRIDQELEQRIAILAGALRRGSEPPNRLPPLRPPRPDRQTQESAPPVPLEDRLTPRDLSYFDASQGNDFYYVVWQRDGSELTRSPDAPPELARPERADAPRMARTRNHLRERIHFLPPGDCVLVGRDIGEELGSLRRFGWLLAGAGGVVLALGLAGGWWISARSLRPIRDISATAARIASGDLSQRIPAAAAGSELDDLARVLNQTFARLQASFARQAQFTADASHELRTPVSVVLTQTQSALARERSAEEYRESLAACQRAAQRMRRLTESLLTLARLDSGDATVIREACDLERITREAVDLLQPLAQEQQIQLTLKSSPCPCEGNAEQLGQVVTNLVSNAIAYNHPGGSVAVTVAAENGGILLQVSDTGQGIGPEHLPHLFERFYRVDKARSNAAGRTGLGLAITKAIVQAHGGAIEVATELDKGSTFTVRLAAEK